MAADLPHLDRDALERLRHAVKSLRQARRSVPLRGLVTLAASRPPGTAITVDFGASRDLGHELIIVRLPALPAHPDDRPLATLSPREREIAGLIASGFTNKEIASQLSIAASTVKDHVHHILQKSGLRNRAAIAACVPAAGEYPARTPTLARSRGKRNPPLDG